MADEDPQKTPYVVRRIPEVMTAAWATATTDPDPLVALGSVRALAPLLQSWEAQLVREAQAEGATWETIGGAVGVSRQAAWARFNDDRQEFKRVAGTELRQLRERHRNESVELRQRLANEYRSRRPQR